MIYQCFICDKWKIQLINKPYFLQIRGDNYTASKKICNDCGDQLNNEHSIQVSKFDQQRQQD